MAVSQQIPDIVVRLSRQTPFPEVMWITERGLQQVYRLSEIAASDILQRAMLLVKEILASDFAFPALPRVELASF
ncbi:hypothetical protein D3C86_1646270 [compost metagenome]